MPPINAVLLLAANEIPAQELNSFLPSNIIYTMPYNGNVMHALCGEFREVGQALQKLDAEGGWELQRFDGFQAGMFKEFKDSDASRWKDAHYKAMFTEKKDRKSVFDNGRLVAPSAVAERQRHASAPQPPPSIDNDKRIEDLEFELCSVKLKNELLESKLADQKAEIQSLRSDMGKRAMELMKEWRAPIEEMRLRADMRHHEHVRRLYAALKAAQEGKPPVMGPFGPRDPGAF
jgi:hypothetical protein